MTNPNFVDVYCAKPVPPVDTAAILSSSNNVQDDTGDVLLPQEEKEHGLEIEKKRSHQPNLIDVVSPLKGTIDQNQFSHQDLLEQCKLMLTKITEGITATAGKTPATTPAASAAAASCCHDTGNSSSSSSSTADGEDYNVIETTIKLFDVLSNKHKRKHTEIFVTLTNINNHNDTNNRSREDLLEQCKMMLTEITERITAAAGTTTEVAASASSSVAEESRSHDTGSNSTTGGNDYNLDITTMKLYDILSTTHRRNHTEILVAFTNNDNRNDDTVGGISCSTNRKRLRADEDPASKELQFPTSIIINHVLPYLDHNTWKSVSILSTGIHGTIHNMKLFPPWPTTRDIPVKFNNEFSVSFDHTNSSRLVAFNPEKNLGLIFDSKRGLIKKIHFDTIKERKRAFEDQMYLLDRKILFLKLVNEDHPGTHSLYLYRLVEDDSSPRNAVGFERIRHSTTTSKDGPWFFRRNGLLYVATAQGRTGPNKYRPSETIVIYQYLGETAWPGCLHETHRLQYPEIDFKDDDDDDDDEDEEEYCQNEVFKYIGQPSKNNYCSTIEERIILVSITNNGNLHVHCWYITFDHQKSGSGNINDRNNGNSGGKQVPCISFGKTPDLQLGFLDFQKRHEMSLKIIPWPNKDNNNYIFRIMQYFPAWWEMYEDDVESLKRTVRDHLAERWMGYGMHTFGIQSDGRIYGEALPSAYKDLLGTYNMDNIFLFDYNMVTNKFDNTNNLSLTNQDQSVLQYDHVFSSHDGRHLFTLNEEDDVCVFSIDVLGCSLITNFKPITGKTNRWVIDTEGLSNDDKIIGIPLQGSWDEDRPGRIHIKYLYIN